jgi:hypothetical protein
LIEPDLEILSAIALAVGDVRFSDDDLVTAEELSLPDAEGVRVFEFLPIDPGDHGVGFGLRLVPEGCLVAIGYWLIKFSMFIGVPVKRILGRHSFLEWFAHTGMGFRITYGSLTNSGFLYSVGSNSFSVI